MHSDRIRTLGDETISAAEARSELLKWKLVLVAGLGAAALGMAGQSNPAPLLLALIPLVCLYVDLLCYHLTIRQLAIGAYFRHGKDDAYEKFCEKARGIFELEDWAMLGSTSVFCIFCIVAGFIGNAERGTDSEDIGAKPTANAIINTIILSNSMLITNSTATTFVELPLAEKKQKRADASNLADYHNSTIIICGILGLSISLVLKIWFSTKNKAIENSAKDVFLKLDPRQK